MVVICDTAFWEEVLVFFGELAAKAALGDGFCLLGVSKFVWLRLA